MTSDRAWSRSGLHHVVPIGDVAVVDVDGHAVADDAGAAGHLDDVTEHLGGAAVPAAPAY